MVFQSTISAALLATKCAMMPGQVLRVLWATKAMGMPN
jgi:hypothetical protein